MGIALRWKFKPPHKGISEVIVLSALFWHEGLKAGILNVCIKLILETSMNHEFIRRPFTRPHLSFPWWLKVRLTYHEPRCLLPRRTTLVHFPTFFFLWKISEFFSDSKQKWTKPNKIDSNYSYKCLETISCIKTTLDHINLTCKLKNKVTIAAKNCNK